MKMPFRFFRGEFMRGTYLKTLLTFLNFTLQDVMNELVYQILTQFKLESELNKGELAMRDEDIFNIGCIAGLFPSRVNGKTTAGSIRFTSSHLVAGAERSERGLFDMDNEISVFVRVDSDNYPTDIAEEATKTLRIGFVPAGTKPVGYLPAGTDLYTKDGEVIWANLLKSPPMDGTPYTPYYDEKFLVFEQQFERETFLSPEIFKLLLECLQRIRYNGPTIAEFLEVTKLLVGGYLFNIEIVPYDRYYAVMYDLQEDSLLDNKERRLQAWFDICQQKFKLFFLEHRGF